MLDALSEAYSTAKALYRRHTALPSLEAACELCKFTIAKCEALMELRDADDSASDSGDDSGDDEGRQRDWTKWLTGKCQGVTRLQLLKELTPKLQLCVQTLQLALVALPLRIDRAALLPARPFAMSLPRRSRRCASPSSSSSGECAPRGCASRPASSSAPCATPAARAPGCGSRRARAP